MAKRKRTKYHKDKISNTIILNLKLSTVHKLNTRLN